MHYLKGNYQNNMATQKKLIQRFLIEEKSFFKKEIKDYENANRIYSENIFSR